ncbi:Quinoprotein alcohol dehydrogenase-like superfamily [Arabidopsis thaliana x Arabidopsis arenosa]|uniref:Quinoprotein alcohol dehydrogenase-like superfamily n=1 Tax=Arabidopsis thaliana x Arabidopsis arenosa TaxID=1240361 RepID=A0A8T1ZLA9_9BRAS|nr:Quinoprotein alcohol dehydrogenase-like superfamily [Arabidopsis thaliana x Arabidopsis arenosa]
MAASKPSPTDTWDSTLPGPPSRNNFGSADLSPSGLFAFASGSSVSVVDSRSLQLVSTIPLPPPPGALSPFVTSVRWIPLPLPRDLLSTEPSASHLLLAVADRHGRVALVDFHLRSVVLWLNPSSDPKLGIQDLCWVQARQDSHVLAAISGSSSLSLYTTSGGLFWKYDAGTEILSCLRRDPYDSRHFCVLGLKGFLLSVKVLGDTENDVVIQEMQIKTDFSELLRLEREAASNGNSSSSSPASAAFPLYFARFAFSPHWKNILFVTFPRELLVFDLQYETPLSTTPLPRGCAKFLDVLPDPNKELLYCAHVDGRLSIWRRKEGEQLHVMCTMEEFMPSIGMSIPSPSALAVLLSHSDSTMQTITKLHPDGTSSIDFDNPFDFYDESLLVSKTTFISLSDDGKIWKWVLSAEGVEDALKNASDLDMGTGGTAAALPGAIQENDSSRLDDELVVAPTNRCRGHTSSSSMEKSDLSFKISLTGQLQLLSSTVSTLAVPSPSLTATLARGGNIPAAAVPLVALGTQSGTIDVVDVSTNAVAASTSVHTGVVRGLRWLGNSRLVSFSYSQVNDKSRGYINKLVVTCLRSGLNKPFRDLQKPERTPIRALRTSSSGRYLLILFRDAPVEVWAMTKHPVMLRSLALPFTVVEWTLPAVPRPGQGGPSKQSLSASEGVTASADSSSVGSDGSQEETVESFAFALVNGALGVFEVQGRRIRDFRPKWPSTSFVPSDGLVTAMAYRLPHVVMGDRSGNIRWWDVTTGQSSAFNSHRDGIRRIKFSPVVAGDRSRGRVAVLFNDNTFSVFDLDSPDPLAQSLLQPQIPGTLVLELDWLPLRTDKNDPLVLCIAGADSTFRLVEVTVNEKKAGFVPQSKSVKERFRPMPMYSPILLPVPHALALRMILQLGVKPSWFNTSSTTLEKRPHLIRGMASSSKDLRSYMIQLPPLGDPVVPEMLLKILEPYRKEGCLLDDERAKLYADVVKKGYAARFAFAASVFGETSEALFWLQLPQAIRHLMNKLTRRSLQKIPSPTLDSGVDEVAMLSKIPSIGVSAPEARKIDSMCDGSLRLMAFEREELRTRANERLPWHEKLDGEDCIQKQVHELISVGNLEAAVSLLLSSAPDSPYFYPNALRAVALASAVSKSLLDLALKVVAANMVRTDNSLTGTHLLCAVGRHQEACSQLQDSGRWTDAATLAATHLEGSDYARVLQRWADHVLHAEHNVWRALILYVAAGSLQEAFAALREVQQPDTVAMFVLACQEIHSEIITELSTQDKESASSEGTVPLPDLPGLESGKEEVTAVCEYFQQYQRKLVHLCMDSQPYTD